MPFKFQSCLLPNPLASQPCLCLFHAFWIVFPAFSRETVKKCWETAERSRGKPNFMCLEELGKEEVFL